MAKAKEPSAAPTAVPEQNPGTAVPRKVDEKPVAVGVFIHADSSGKNGCLNAPPIHEVILLRRKLEAFGEHLTLDPSWPERTTRERAYTVAMLNDEYARLRQRYVFVNDGGTQIDLLADVYGPAHNGRLVSVMRKMHLAFVRLEKACEKEGRTIRVDELEAIVDLAKPEGDFVEAPEESPAAVQ